MMKTTPTPAMTATELEAWFGEGGISATVVERCPEPTCPMCGQPPSGALADAA
jgi:hypothetical protein